MTKEPNEKWLDRHFAQQLEEYEPVFQQEASASDQELITYWLQIFLAAPKPQKWARNSLMLLMYGHLKEIGYLQVPFTDVNSMGKNLNKVLDGYTGLPVVTTNRTRSTHVLTPIPEEKTPSPPETEKQTPSPPETEASTPYPPETEVQTPSQLETEESTTAKEDIYSNRTASIKRQLSYRSSLEEATLGRESTRSSASSHQTLYDTFDSHECYQSATERLLCMAESGRMLQVEAVVESMRRLDGPPLSTISEESISKVNDRALQKSCSKLYKEIIKAKGGNFEQMQDVDSTSSRASSEATEKRVASAAARRKVTALIEPTRRHSPESSPGQTTRRDNEAELTYLRRRNKQLRRECLIYYHRNGKLRKYPKYPKIDAQALGFQVAAYRAHARLARWQVLSGVPQYFHQEYDRKNGWRTYRRILLATAVPRSVLRRPVTPRRARPRVPLRLSDILPLKHIYTEMGASRMCYGHGIWAQNITLADHMQCNPRTSVE
ncbi:uncharacterized protein LOC108650357 [Drosophila navojoa]|uniref:uncharacterized protein LOC108650357 n=1 Tax=Drosophila navojoa TaxID=7232 RepID=UPI0011BDB60B|nr:uncharacterized protein LOC108650357 [Drosophila navojoa]